MRAAVQLSRSPAAPSSQFAEDSLSSTWPDPYLLLSSKTAICRIRKRATESHCKGRKPYGTREGGAAIPNAFSACGESRSSSYPNKYPRVRYARFKYSETFSQPIFSQFRVLSSNNFYGLVAYEHPPPLMCRVLAHWVLYSAPWATSWRKTLELFCVRTSSRLAQFMSCYRNRLWPCANVAARCVALRLLA